jgi:hypothetical protein
MIFIIIFAISLATIFFLSWWYLGSTRFNSFCFGFLGLILGALIGIMFCTLTCATICDDDHLINTETYSLAQINIANASSVLASNYVLDEGEDSDLTVYMIKDDILVRLKVRPEHIHFVTTDTARVVKNIYHFKTKLCRLLFEYTSIYIYECYVPMQPLTSS